MRRIGALVLIISCLLTGVAIAAAPAGKAVGVNPSATATVANSTKTLVVGSDVAIGDKIVTGPGGQVQLVFNDDTHLVVGPSSSLVVESYLLRSDKSVGKFAVSALGGSFRFITGKSDHDAYTINTPTGTIGVRGTKFDFHILQALSSGHVTHNDPHTWSTIVALFDGAVQLCDLDKKCVVLDHKCDAGVINPSDTFKVGKFQAVDNNLRQFFPYINSQKPLLDAFKVDTSRFCFINNDPDDQGLSHQNVNPSSEPIVRGEYLSPKG